MQIRRLAVPLAAAAAVAAAGLPALHGRAATPGAAGRPATSAARMALRAARAEATSSAFTSPSASSRRVPPRPGTTITVSAARPGPTFDGIGAISGGGGNSRLLVDYPTTARRQILNLLFEPHYGASLQMLKIEIGGDANSTDGSEPSVEHAPGQVDCGAGYELWLARQASARAPGIKLYGLQWAAPAWVDNGHGALWSRADVGYVMDWMRCARAAGLTVGYLGGWNERYTPAAPQVQAWFEELRAALDAAGFAGTQLVAADVNSRNPVLDWRVVADMLANPAFDRSVGVVGVHDTCGHPSTGYVCESTPAARRLSRLQGKPLWESELGMTPALGVDPARAGPGGLARVLNNSYLQAGVTGVILWPLVDSMPPNLPYENRGLITADYPWSGYYRVNPLTWVVAQTTQFTAPGWHYLPAASGFLPGRAHSSYVTYAAPDRSAWSLVAQTSVARGPQRITVHVTRGLPRRVVREWATSLRGGPQFVEGPRLLPRHGSFTQVLYPGEVYTFTTTTGQSKAGGQALRVPPPAALPLPYTPVPDRAGMPRLLAPVEGSFGYVHGVLTQTAVGRPVEWHYPGPYASPYAIVGGPSWRNYTVRATVSLPPAAGGPAPGAMLITRFEGYDHTKVSQFRGYALTIDSRGRWRVLRNGPLRVQLASGRVAAADRYRLRLSSRGVVISAAVDGRTVARVASTSYLSGPAGLGSLGYYPVRYLSFSVR